MCGKNGRVLPSCTYSSAYESGGGGRPRVADPPDHAAAVSLGGLAAEELGEPFAWGSGRRDPDAKETPAEHADFNPRSAQEHEMETVGSASTKALFIFILHRRCVMFMFVCSHQKCARVYMDPWMDPNRLLRDRYPTQGCK